MHRGVRMSATRLSISGGCRALIRRIGCDFRQRQWHGDTGSSALGPNYQPSSIFHRMMPCVTPFVNSSQVTERVWLAGAGRENRREVRGDCAVARRAGRGAAAAAAVARRSGCAA